MYTKQPDDENVAEIFCKRLWSEIEKVWSSEVKPMVMTDYDKMDFDNAAECWICQKDFTEKDKKVRDPIVISPENTEVLPIKNTMHFSESLNLFQCFFII